MTSGLSMQIEVELDIYSGRENPRWSLDSAQATRVVTLLRSEGRQMLPEPRRPALGYRGFVLRFLEVPMMWPATARVWQDVVSHGEGPAALHILAPGLEATLASTIPSEFREAYRAMGGPEGLRR